MFWVWPKWSQMRGRSDHGFGSGCSGKRLFLCVFWWVRVKRLPVEMPPRLWGWSGATAKRLLIGMPPRLWFWFVCISRSWLNLLLEGFLQANLVYKPPFYDVTPQHKKWNTKNENHQAHWATYQKWISQKKLQSSAHKRFCFPKIWNKLQKCTKKSREFVVIYRRQSCTYHN